MQGGVQAQGHRPAVLVDEFRTTRVSSAVNGQEPSQEQRNKRQLDLRLVRSALSQRDYQPGLLWCPQVPPLYSSTGPCSQAGKPGSAMRTKAEQAAEPTQPNKGKGKAQGKAAKAKPAPQPGRWLDRDCNAALNMQRIGESRWRPLELCRWPEQADLPAKGKEYPGLGYKRLRAC
ncbi:hypothetical protein QJQ45_009778 [Haematococcus lacustris]|nr:hypothetical protein QJQ45_009778 [Haematococcus lacustris]